MSLSILTPIQTELDTIAQLSGCLNMLQWDQECGLPSQSISSRAQQKATLARLIHQTKSSSAIRDFLSDHVDLSSGHCHHQDLTADHASLIRQLHRDWRLTTALPESFVSEWETVTSLAQHEWQQARQAADYSRFQPHLSTIIDLCRQKADFLGYAHHPYEALLDLYEPGMTLSLLDSLFTPLYHHIRDILPAPTPPILDWSSGDFPIDDQVTFNQRLLADTGFRLEHGRLDASTHPFTIHMHPHDVRITTRYNDADPLEAISSTLHEAGHGLYEQGLNPDWFGTPWCESASLGIHESQSRLWENWIGKSDAYWTHYYPKLLALFPTALDRVPLTQFMHHMRHISPSLIRVEADEVTYQLHIMIRYELEKQLISGDLSTHDLPDAWRQLYRDYLGVTPANDAEGVLQDVHWSCGIFGYFPTYTLGNIYAAQLYERMIQDLPSFTDHVENAHFEPILSWLRRHVHVKGRRQTPIDLMQDLTEKPLSIDALVRYFEPLLRA